MTDPRRILLVRLSHLGDVCHALPVFHALRAGYPDAELAWVVQREFAELVEGLPGLDRAIPFDRRGGPRAWGAVHAELARFRADWAIDAQGNVKSALIALASGAPRRSGYHPAQWTERIGAWSQTDAAGLARASTGTSIGETRNEPAAPPHALDRALALARHVAPGVSEARIDPGLTADERAAGRAALAEAFGDAEPEGCMLVHLGVPGDVRTWPLERVLELARALDGEGVPTLLVSGPGEEAAGQAARAALAGTAARHLVGQRGLRALAALFAAAAERGGRLVASDSGPLHLGASVGLPCVAPVGPQDPRRTGPWPVPRATDGSTHESPERAGAGHRIVVASHAPPCAPCRRRRCDHPEGPVCMSRLSAERVLAALAPRGARAQRTT